MKRVLLVSPHFPPINAPDHQRVRMALPYLKEFGWDPVVLAVKPEAVESTPDPYLGRTVPGDVPVFRTSALPARLTRSFGMGSLALRSLPFLWNAGNRLLKEPFDLVFFSTTLFPVTALGPFWRKRFGVPYAVDFQDPWRSHYHDRPDASEPPGGRVKYGLSQGLAKILEPRVVKGANHILCVSPAYQEILQRHYPELDPKRFSVIPFGGASGDFETLAKLGIRQSIFNPEDGNIHWVYVGRGGSDVSFSLRAFFKAFSEERHINPERWARLRLHFIGTDYAPPGRGQRTVRPIAEECGVADAVEEWTERIPYFEALACLRDAGALIVPGSDDSGYTASKIYPVILARKPLLAVFHEKSTVVEVLNKTRAGVVVTFNQESNMNAVVEKIRQLWFHSDAAASTGFDSVAFAPYSAKEMTRRLCEIFNHATEREL